MVGGTEEGKKRGKGLEQERKVGREEGGANEGRLHVWMVVGQPWHALSIHSPML